MTSIRSTLGRLGWPVDNMSEKQLKQELYRRWFKSQPAEQWSGEGSVNVASAKGIFVSMATDGNLDALCWAPGDAIPESEEGFVTTEEERIYVREPKPDTPPDERRRSPRTPAKEMIRWRPAHEDADNVSGWLVDRSANGIAFIVPTEMAPIVGAEITSSVLTRTKGSVNLGIASVVRVDPLNDELSLVCAELQPEEWLDTM